MGEREKRWDKMHALITYLIVTLINFFFFFFLEREKPKGGMTYEYIYIYIYIILLLLLLLKFCEMFFFSFKLFYLC